MSRPRRPLPPYLCRVSATLTPRVRMCCCFLPAGTSGGRGRRIRYMFAKLVGSRRASRVCKAMDRPMAPSRTGDTPSASRPLAGPWPLAWRPGRHRAGPVGPCGGRRRALSARAVSCGSGGEPTGRGVRVRRVCRPRWWWWGSWLGAMLLVVCSAPVPPVFPCNRGVKHAAMGRRGHSWPLRGCADAGP